MGRKPGRRFTVEQGTFPDGSAQLCGQSTEPSTCLQVAWPFGWTVYQQRTYGKPAVWHGSILDQKRGGSALVYRRHRFYDPALGRFTQEAPIGLAGGLNPYGYADGDPINFSDPFGLWCQRRDGGLHCENLGPGDFYTIRDYLGGEAGESAFRTFQAAGWTQWNDQNCRGGFSSAQCTQLAESLSTLTLNSDDRCSSLGVSATKRFQAGRFRLRSNVDYLGYAQKFWPWGQIRLNEVLFGERANQLTEIVAHEARHFQNPFAGGGPLGIFHGFGDSVYRLGEYCGR